MVSSWFSSGTNSNSCPSGLEFWGHPWRLEFWGRREFRRELWGQYMELSLQDHGTHEGIYNVHGLPGNEYPGISTADVDERHLPENGVRS